MPIRVEVALRKAVTDTQGNKTAHKIKNELGLTVDQVRIIRVYTVDGLTKAQIDEAIAAGALHDPVLHSAQTTPAAEGFDWIIEVGFRPGVTDNEGRTARETLRTVLGDDGLSVECIAQSWSEHCKHKIFSANITYTEDGKTERIRSGSTSPASRPPPGPSGSVTARTTAA
jgi:phosphoribosylformylglycinamidine (FGAM) synthase PurS component